MYEQLFSCLVLTATCIGCTNGKFHISVHYTYCEKCNICHTAEHELSWTLTQLCSVANAIPPPPHLTSKKLQHYVFTIIIIINNKNYNNINIIIIITNHRLGSSSLLVVSSALREVHVG